MLFSEFVFDLPVALPEPLKGVPHAPMRSQTHCRGCLRSPAERTRSHVRVYIERAEAIEVDSICQRSASAIEDLGERDTFPFEERTFLRTAIKGIVHRRY